MSNGNGHEPPRELLEQRANIARARLMDTIDALNVRRHHATDVKYQLQHHKKPLIMIGAGVLLLIASGVTAGVLSARRRERSYNRARLEAVRRWWRHPERVAVRAHDRPFALQFLQKLGMTVATFALGQVLHRAIAPRLLPPRAT
jgi:hypothetical protein